MRSGGDPCGEIFAKNGFCRCVRGMVRGKEKGLAVVFPQVPEIFGAPGAIRTHGLWLRRPTLYPTELRAHTCLSRQRACRCQALPLPASGASRLSPENGPCPSSGRDAARHHGRPAPFRDSLLVLRYTFFPRFGAPPNKENNHEPDPLVRPFGLQYQL